MKRRLRFALGLWAVGMPTGLLLHGGCGGATDPMTSDDASLPPTAPTDAGGRRDVEASTFVPPRPGSVPAGWELYTDYDPACGIYIPTDKQYLPEPIKWGPCNTMDKGNGLPGPDGMVCQRMVFDWNAGTTTNQHTTGGFLSRSAPMVA